MVSSALAHQARYGWQLIGFTLLGVGLVAVAWLSGLTHRQPSAPVEPAEPAAATAEPATPSVVRLPSGQIRAAAGIEVAPAQSVPLANTMSCFGSASFNQNSYVKVPPRAEGMLGPIKVDVGSRVKPGDVLAIVKSQSIGDLKKSYVNALVHEEHLRWQVQRFQAVGDGVPAKNLFETQHLLEEQINDTARIRERLAEFGYTADEIEDIAKKKQIGVELVVVAPRGGTVVQRQAVEGEPVLATTPLFAIANLDTMWVHLNVYESNLSHIHLGQNVRFWPDGLPGQSFAGQVTWISPEVDPQTRTIQVRAEVVNRDGALRANMFGKGELVVDEPLERLVVPETAVQTHEGAHIVFVEQPHNVFQVRQVQVGLKHDRQWEITSGLAAGERVATIGSFLLKSNLENPEFGQIIED